MRSGDVPLGDGELILLVDDDQKVLKLTHAILEGLGYAVISAENGPQAMAVMERGDEVDLVLSDIIMPGGMSGYDVARTVGTSDPISRSFSLPVSTMRNLRAATGFWTASRCYANLTREASSRKSCARRSAVDRLQPPHVSGEHVANTPDGFY